jgi:predicted DCC family thiol-disulfide oxidoreductase YuxK
VTTKRTFQDRLKEFFSIDLRSLALFRIGLGVLLISDLINRASFLRAHYSDWGILPRDIYIDQFIKPWHLSIHLISGHVAVQAALFVLAGIFAFALLIGYRTRLATLVSWLLLISLHSRNPMVLQGGDVLFRLLLFWALFLPLGARYSVDSALDSDHEEKPVSMTSVGTVALLLQVCMVYWFTAILKHHPIWYQDWTAVYYALNIDQFVTPFGKYLLSFPSLLKLITFATIVLEALGPFLAFSPYLFGPLRLFTTILFISLHASFVTTLEIGLFPYISMVGWLVFIPTWFWERLFQRLRTVKRLGLRIYYDGDCGFCKKTALLLRTFFLLPETPLHPTEVDPSIHRDMIERNSWVVLDAAGNRHYGFEALVTVLETAPLVGVLVRVLRVPFLLKLGEALYKWIANNRQVMSRLTRPLQYRPVDLKIGRLATGLAAICLIYIVCWNVRTLDFDRVAKYFPRKVNGFAYLFRIDQYWNMFSKFPMKDDGWYVIPGTLFSEKEIDIFQGNDPVSWDKPVSVAATYPNQRWRKFMMNIWKKKNKGYRPYYSAYLCRAYNEGKRCPDRLKKLRIYNMREDTKLDPDQIKARKVKLYSHNCFGRPPR